MKSRGKNGVWMDFCVPPRTFWAPFCMWLLEGEYENVIKQALLGVGPQSRETKEWFGEKEGQKVNTLSVDIVKRLKILSENLKEIHFRMSSLNTICGSQLNSNTSSWTSGILIKLLRVEKYFKSFLYSSFHTWSSWCPEKFIFSPEIRQLHGRNSPRTHPTSPNLFLSGVNTRYYLLQRAFSYTVLLPTYFLVNSNFKLTLIKKNKVFAKLFELLLYLLTFFSNLFFLSSSNKCALTVLQWGPLSPPPCGKTWLTPGCQLRFKNQETLILWLWYSLALWPRTSLASGVIYRMKWLDKMF